jgi:hypothetical protein
MALAVAIFALVVVASLVAMAFYSGRLEQRAGRHTMYAAQAADAAEAGAAVILGNWDQYALNNLAVGATALEDSVKVGGAGRSWYRQSVRRLNNELFLVQSLGSRTDAAGRVVAQRSVGTIARLSYVSATAKAAVTVTNPIKFNGNSFAVNGNDAMPAGWGVDSLGNADPNCALGANQAGVRSATSTGAAPSDNDNLFGSPPQVANDSTVTSDFFNIFGDVTFDELAQNADIVISSATPQMPAPTLLGTAPFRCDVADNNNWGEPWRSAGWVKACSTYFPIIHSTGSQLKMSAGARGQGLLLIEGDLEITGGFEFAGLIVAKGGIKINGNGNKITGALLAQNVSLDDNSLSGNTTLQYSFCALNKAIQGSAMARPLGQRGWVQLY